MHRALLSTAALLLPLLAAAPVLQAQASATAPADTPELLAFYQHSVALYDQVRKEHEHYADVNGIRLYYLEWGDRSGTPLIWSPASSSTAFEMYGVAERLVDAGYHLLALTPRGHGQTSANGKEFSLADMADDIHAFMEYRKLACAVIGGWSLGGDVSTSFYESYPRQAMGIVLEDGGGDVFQNRIERFVAAVPGHKAADWHPRGGYLSRYELFRAAAGEYEALQPAPKALDAAQRADRELRKTVSGIWILSTLRQNPQGTWDETPEMNSFMQAWPAIEGPARNHESGLLGQSLRRINPFITYRNLSVPLLLFNPTADDENGKGFNYMTPDYQRLKAQHPSLVEVVTYPDASHEDAHLGNTQRFIADMQAFLTRVRASGADRCLDAGKP